MHHILKAKEQLQEGNKTLQQAAERTEAELTRKEANLVETQQQLRLKVSIGAAEQKVDARPVHNVMQH